MSSTRLFPLALVSALLLSTAVLAQGGGGGGGGGAEVEGRAAVAPVEVPARAVLPEQAAAVRVLLRIRLPILQARPGAAPIL